MLKFRQMYIREILPPKSSPIENGNPVVGTWNRAFEKVDLLEIHRPYGCPQARWIRNFQIKEWQSFSAHSGSYLLEALFFNVKMYRIAQVILYDTENNQKFVFRKSKPGAGWQLPLSLSNSSVDSRSSDFYFRIHNWLDADTVKLDINIQGSKKQQPLTVHLAYDLNCQEVIPMTVSLAFSKQRIMYAYKALAPVRGDIVFEGKHINLKHDSCSGIFCDCKGIFPYHMHTKICSAAGFDEENRRFGFYIAENQTRETNKNNENALWVNGKLTPLPPVLITMPGGHDDVWIIQDIEGMVDLTFTPKEHIKSGIGLVFMKADYSAPLGYYNGALVNAGGEKIHIKNLLGIGEKLYLRV